MSSSYVVLCLSHDPAVVAADRDWNRPGPAEEAVAAGIEGHENCDLMITRHSGALVELGCPASSIQPRPVGHAGRCIHRGTKWADIAWIRLLLVAQREAAGTAVRVRADAAGVRCWTPTRLERLRVELGAPDQQPAVEPSTAGEAANPEPPAFTLRTNAGACRYLASQIADLAFGDPTTGDLSAAIEGIRVSLLNLAEQLDP